MKKTNNKETPNEVTWDIGSNPENDTNQIQKEKGFKDKPGEFGGLHWVLWLLIIAYCLFLGMLLAW